MSITVYAAIVTPLDCGTKLCEPVMDFEHSNQEVLVDNPHEADDPFRPNEKYIPGVSMDISGGNWVDLIDRCFGMPTGSSRICR